MTLGIIAIGAGIAALCGAAAGDWQSLIDNPQHRAAIASTRKLEQSVGAERVA